MAKYRKVKHKPPSRIRYEKTHPTISFVVDLETKTRLKKVLDEKESFASFIKEAIGVREREKKTEKEAHDMGYKKGYHKGYVEAKHEFIVSGECGVCGKEMIVYTVKDKERVANLMRSERWCHAECVREQRGYRI